jgi:DNA-binding transcriptional LysR family regulator
MIAWFMRNQATPSPSRASQPRAWPVWLTEAGLSHLTPRGHLWLDSVPAMLEAAEQGLGVTLGMSPLIKARPGFGKKLVAPFAFEATHSETLYLVSRTEQARDRRIATVRRWIVDAVAQTKIARDYNRPPVRTSRTISSRMTAPMVE